MVERLFIILALTGGAQCNICRYLLGYLCVLSVSFEVLVSSWEYSFKLFLGNKKLRRFKTQVRLTEPRESLLGSKIKLSFEGKFKAF